MGLVLLTATSLTLPLGRLHSSTLASILPRTSARLAATSTTASPSALLEAARRMVEEAPARAEAREAWEVTEWTEVGSIVILLPLVTRAAKCVAGTVLLLRDRLVVEEKAAEELMKRAARQVVADVRSLIAVWGSEAATAPIVMEL